MPSKRWTYKTEQVIEPFLPILTNENTVGRGIANMYYDTKKRVFVFENKAEAKPCALLFRDMPHLLSKDEEICPEVEMLAEALPHPLPEDIMRPSDPDALAHQDEAIGWVLRQRGTGIVAYGMGLGKTFIAIRSSIYLRRRRVLVVCPSHLKHNWHAEISMWAKGTLCHICEGREASMPPVAQLMVFAVINRDILADNKNALLRQGFDQIVVDECHKCGGWGTAAYTALDELCADVRKRKGGILLMTGTLFKNSPMDAHTALHLLDPRIPGGRVAFQSRFDPLGQKKQEVLGLMRRANAPQWLIGKKWAEIKALEKEHGKNGDVEGLRWLLARYAIRKKYNEVFPDDGKTRETKFVSVDLELTDGQRRILSNRAVEEEGVVKGELATVLRIVAEKKAPFVADFAEGWLEENEGKKLVIATWHIAAREIIRKALEPYGVVEIGGTPAQKAKAEKAFRDNQDIRVCLLNLDSGGTGLNLVSAAHLIFSEVPWTSAAFDQVKARIDRIGQEADRLLYTVFLAADTPEGAKFGTVRKKSGLNDRYM